MLFSKMYLNNRKEVIDRMQMGVLLVIVGLWMILNSQNKDK